MKSLFLFSFLFMLIGCSSSKELRFDKKYSRSGNRYYVNLELRPDSTFTLTKAYIEWPKKCSGIVSKLEDRRFLLKCNEEDQFSTPTPNTGYLETRQHIITVLTSRKVRIEKENTILKIR